MLQAVKKDYYEPYDEEYQVSIKHNDNKREKAKLGKTFKIGFRAKAVVAVITCFAVCFIILYRYSLITESTYNLNQCNKELQRLVTSNSRLKIEAEKSVDLINIESIAKNRLGMQHPDQYQIVYVKVPRQDHTQVANNADGHETYPKTGFTGIKSVFLNGLNGNIVRFVRFLY